MRVRCRFAIVLVPMMGGTGQSKMAFPDKQSISHEPFSKQNTESERDERDTSRRLCFRFPESDQSDLEGEDKNGRSAGGANAEKLVRNSSFMS